MCGIVAAFGDIDLDKCERMLGRLNHRGPDDKGVAALDGAWLGHQRLSIVDVMGGHQPLTNDEGTAFVVGNGEIYNHETLRADLAPHTTRTRSDTEAALHLTLRDGASAIAELGGMFALAMATTDGNGLAARDAMGIKPLYWARRGDCTLFASEMRTFDVEDQSLVEEFPPGCLWTPNGGLVRFAHAVPARVRPATRAVEQHWDDVVCKQIRDTLIASVRLRMMSDVPVGVFLSGGLDSAIIAAIAARESTRRGERLPTFAVGTPESSDLRAARRVAEYLDTDHHEVLVTAETLREALGRTVGVIEHYDPTLVRSAVPNLLLAEEAANHVKVVLTGEGADELFAGYAYMHQAEFHDPNALQAELVHNLHELHHLNLQRADRTTMAFGLEARVPFLDLEMIATALALPAEWKLTTDGRPEKDLLRDCFDGWLPPEILHRTKEQFGEGSGAKDVLAEIIEEQVRAHGRVGEEIHNGWALRTAEEAHYYDIWRKRFPGVRPNAVVGAFASAG